MQEGLNAQIQMKIFAQTLGGYTRNLVFHMKNSVKKWFIPKEILVQGWKKIFEIRFHLIHKFHQNDSWVSIQETVHLKVRLDQWGMIRKR